VRDNWGGKPHLTKYGALSRPALADVCQCAQPRTAASSASMRQAGGWRLTTGGYVHPSLAPGLSAVIESGLADLDAANRSAASSRLAVVPPSNRGVAAHRSRLTVSAALTTCFWGFEF
jgi:hypothetical protein